MAVTIMRANLAAQIRDVLIERVRLGQIAPGERLVELAIAREFGTSQAPVREALRMLEAVGLLESVPHRGTRVRTLSERELFEGYVTRALLEEGAARYAAAHVFARSPEAVAELRAATEAQLEAARAGDLPAVARHNAAFHRRVVAAAGNGILLATWESLGTESRGVVTLGRKTYDVVEATRQHLPIIEALAAGDAAAAAHAIREHGLFFARLHDTGPDAWAAQVLAGTPGGPVTSSPPS